MGAWCWPIHDVWADSAELRIEHWSGWDCIFDSQFLDINSGFAVVGILGPEDNFAAAGRDIFVADWAVLHSSFRAVYVAVLLDQELLLQ